MNCKEYYENQAKLKHFFKSDNSSNISPVKKHRNDISTIKSKASEKNTEID